MASTAAELKNWLSTLQDADLVAIDDGGLTLVAIGSGGPETGAYFEVGGIPAEDGEGGN